MSYIPLGSPSTRNVPSPSACAEDTVCPFCESTTTACGTAARPARFTTVPFTPPQSPLCAKRESVQSTAANVKTNLFIISLFCYYDVSRVMVAVSSDECTVGESTERCTLVLSLLICEELRVVYSSIIAFLV